MTDILKSEIIREREFKRKIIEKQTQSLLNNIIAFIIVIGFIFGVFIAIERLVWANTDFVLFENNIKLNTNNDDWMEQVQCTNAWVIIKKENITKYRCGDLFPNTINFIQKNEEIK